MSVPRRGDRVRGSGSSSLTNLIRLRLLHVAIYGYLIPTAYSKPDVLELLISIIDNVKGDVCLLKA